MATSFPSISTLLVLSLILYSGIHCRGILLLMFNCHDIINNLQHCGPIPYYTAGECNYLYDTVPGSSNDSTCIVAGGSTVYFSCVVYDRCNSINVLWYKSRNVGGGSEQVAGTPAPGGKFQIFAVRIPANTSNLPGYCSTASFLVIYDFTHNADSGYYWCQIVANGSLLLPSPRGYLSLKLEGDHACGNGDLNHYLSSRLCAEHTISTEPMILTSDYTWAEYNESESDFLRTTLSGTMVTVNPMVNEKDLLYGTTIGILLSIIALILMLLFCLVIVWYRSKQKQL